MLVFVPGLLAMATLLLEMVLVKQTSGLTLSVLGNLKSILTIMIAIAVFHETATLIQCCGLVIALSGVFGYSMIKKKASS